jgi:hypothetical protein
MNKDAIRKEVVTGLVWAGVMLGLSLAVSLAHRLGYVDRDTAMRVTIGAIGLWIAWNGNIIPKRFAPSADARRAQRVAAWSMVLSGLLYAGLWAFAPIRMATWLGTGTVLMGVVVTFANCLMLQARAKAA